MDEIKINAGTLRLTRNLSIIATTGCLVVGSMLASGHAVFPLSPINQSICGGIIDLCAIYPAVIGYKSHMKLKKMK